MNKKLLIWAFAISGFTALVYEVVWSRPLQLIFGSTIYAVSTILTTFFVGFALGSYLFRNKADNSNSPSRLFALLQLGIGIYGLIILGIFKILTPLYLALNIPMLQFLLLFIVIIIPALLFGATWPVVNKTYIDGNQVGKDVGKLYAWNSFGSFLGPITAGFILIPLIGITNTSIIAALLNILVGILIFISSKEKGGKNEN